MKKSSACINNNFIRAGRRAGVLQKKNRNGVDVFIVIRGGLQSCMKSWRVWSRRRHEDTNRHQDKTSNALVGRLLITDEGHPSVSPKAVQLCTALHWRTQSSTCEKNYETAKTTFSQKILTLSITLFNCGHFSTVNCHSIRSCVNVNGLMLRNEYEKAIKTFMKLGEEKHV